ncbi:LLM class flavin-dependent oxidoreductase [Actinomadura sp. DC4]|uniref:LLM class flavin-dependent oxidoreductase n=1 Tax=Actinomadura sp. DC4 TaxID=3055069 RepID=UPI0025B1BBC4|nr:LLM class flavin-dependent oxidoreductase [Actinomadura sp. DC4]MDN3358968.1 LLM class flavin-dependent oxidoreductase [Actinomadura sp. DC4]
MTARRGVAFTPMETRREVIVRAAVLAEELGYESFAVPEGWGLDSTPLLTEVVLRTARIRVASGILSVWGRTPGTLAMTAATLHQISGGRYALGLGASTRALVEGFHDIPFERPADKLRDVVARVRALLGGEPAHLRRVPGAHALRLGQAPAPEVPIWVAALGERTTRVAAELGDGWIPALVARDHLAPWAGRLNRLRESAVPDAGPFTVAAGPITVVDEDPDAARDIAATCTAWYLSGMGGVYARSVSGQGYATQVDAIVAANPRPSPRRGIIPPSARPVLDQLAAYGTRDQVRELIESWDKVTDVVTILLPPGIPWPTVEATLVAAAPPG